MTQISTDGRITKIDGLVTDDMRVAQLLDAEPVDNWPAVMERALVVGAHGLATMGLDIGLEAVREQIRRDAEHATAVAEERVESILAAAEQAFNSQLDPDHRTSLLSRTLREFHQWRTEFFEGMDLNNSESLTAQLLHRLEGVVGSDGIWEQRLAAALDTEADDSSLGRLRSEILQEIRSLRDAVHTQHGKREESEKGTRKGFRFEDLVEDRVRRWAAGIGGCLVHRTSRTGGALGSQALVGDLVLETAGGCRIVLEMKNTARVTLSGPDGILEELDRAMANRQATVGVCVSANDAFPAEAGLFAVYGNRILVVDDGSDAMLDVGLRVAQLVAATLESNRGTEVDRAAVTAQLDRVRSLAKRFSASKRALTDAQSTIETVKSSLDGMRTDLLDLVDRVGAEVQPR